jgi:hypothetical protein
MATILNLHDPGNVQYVAGGVNDAGGYYVEWAGNIANPSGIDQGVFRDPSDGARWGNVDTIGVPHLPLAMPCDSNGWRHLYGPAVGGGIHTHATLLYIQALDTSLEADRNTGEGRGFGSNYYQGIGSPMSIASAVNATGTTDESTGEDSVWDHEWDSILGSDDGWQIVRVGHTQEAPLDEGGGGHAHFGPINDFLENAGPWDIYNDEIARALLQQNHPLIFKSASGPIGSQYGAWHTEGPYGVGLARPTHEYPGQTLHGHRFGPFFVDDDKTTLIRSDIIDDTGVEVSHWNIPQQVVYAHRDTAPGVHFGRRDFVGLIKCTEDHDGQPHGSPGVSLDNSILQAISPTQVIVPVNAAATSQGGLHPELIFYGGDLQGVQGYADVSTSVGTSTATITEIHITDPGASVVAIEKEEQNIVPPEVILSTPNDSTLFEGFAAAVEISTSPEDINAAYDHLDLAVTTEELNADLCAQLGGADPLAQSFLVSSINSEGKGIFVSSVDICFANKAPNLSPYKDPVMVQLRPCTNGGQPSRDLVMDSFEREATVSKTWEEIETYNGIVPEGENFAGGTGIPNFESNFTNFRFPVPVYLQPDTYYAIVVLSNDPAYEVWINDITQNLVVDGELTGTLPEGGATTSESGRVNHGGTLFKSQNGFTWTENQSQDMMFRINRCHFLHTSGTADVHVHNDMSGDYDYDRAEVSTNPGIGTLLPGEGITTIAKEYYTRNLGAVEHHHSDFVENAVNDMPTRRRFRNGQTNGDLKISTTLTTSDNQISPVIDIGQWKLVSYKNLINNGEFQNGSHPANNLITVTDGGSGFVVGEKIAVSGGGGTGAELEVIAAPSNIITEIGFSNMGSGYYKKATVASTGGAIGTGAVITIDGEEGPDGGNAKFRYITKGVNLAAGMDATGLKVFLAAKRPVGSRIYVYYKVKSNLDGAGGGIEGKSWNVMRQVLPDTNYSSDSFMEFEFDTGGDDIVYDSLDSDGNRSTYDTFNVFKIKLVAHAETFTGVPVIKDFRAIAVT